MCMEKSYQVRRGSTTSAAASALALVALALCCDGALAEQAPISIESEQARVTDLEKAFWACDYVGTTHGVSAAPVAACSAVTDALKNERFGGNFAQMLKWWRENKRAVHAELARAQ